MKATTYAGLFPGMTAALGGGMVLEAFSGLPFLFSLAIVIATVAVCFAAGVVIASLVTPRRAPVRLVRTRSVRAIA